MIRRAYLIGMEKGLLGILSGINTFCISVLLTCFVLFIVRSYPSPFYGPSVTDYWVYAADGKTIIDKPASLTVKEGDPIPVGRTLCLRRQTYTHIYKELDAAAADGKTYPLQDPGGGDRVLSAGCQNRISPTILPAVGTASSPPLGDYWFNVYFIVPQNPFVQLMRNGPLIVKLKAVKVRLVG